MFVVYFEIKPEDFQFLKVLIYSKNFLSFKGSSLEYVTKNCEELKRFSFENNG
jgi:hypothetical protein